MIDIHVLQSDLFWLTDWCKTWQLKFNPDKREIVRITHKQNKSKDSYTLDPNGEILKSGKYQRSLYYDIVQSLIL